MMIGLACEEDSETGTSKVDREVVKVDQEVVKVDASDADALEADREVEGAAL
jgi:hypothetical protein